MIRTTPWRRTTLHFTQIFLTDERTFMRVLAPRLACSLAKPRRSAAERADRLW